MCTIPQATACSLIRLSGKIRLIGTNGHTYVSARRVANLSVFWNIFGKGYLTVPGPPGIVPRFAWESFFPKGNATGSGSADALPDAR
jgi:hypothetical protein